MKQLITYLFLLLLTTSCTSVRQSVPTEVLAEFAPTLIAKTAEPLNIPTIPSTARPTLTPVPCDPLSADFCITDGRFLFQLPILPPDNGLVDFTYPYGATQNGKRDPHHGVEFANASGTLVHAAGDGVVVFADSDKTTRLSPWTVRTKVT